MKPGAVIVDLAVEAGGNCPLSKLDQIVTTRNGVKILGFGNVAGRLAEDASQLFSKNLLNFITPLVNQESKELEINWEDEIVLGTLVTRDGQIVHPMLTDKTSKEEGK
jgi:NAD(P) transhydrogenase subunit alpha